MKYIRQRMADKSRTDIELTPLKAEITTQGIMMPPVPKTGRISKMAIKRAIKMEFSTWMMVRPMESSIKVRLIIRA